MKPQPVVPIVPRAEVVNYSHDWATVKFDSLVFDVSLLNDCVFGSERAESRSEKAYQLWQDELRELRTLTLDEIKKKYNPVDLMSDEELDQL